MFSINQQKKEVTELLAGKQIAYFCAEYGLNDALPIYSGGLGVLAGDIVQEAALMKLPFVAVGLFYKLGYFHQHLDPNGQQEMTQTIDPLHVPLELMKTAKGETLLVEVPIQDRTIYVQIWRYPVGENSLYLLDTDHWKNSPEDKAITDQLYGGDQAKRVQQEMILGIGGMQALTALGITPDIYHMNEGHSAFLSLELISRKLKGLEEGSLLPLRDATEAARKQLLFTNHTLVAAGNDLFPYDLIRQYLGSYAYKSGVGIDLVLDLGTEPSHPGFFSMTTLALRMSVLSNAVSKLHAKKAVELWPDYKLQAVTNGVHLPAWIAPELQQVLNQALPDWPLQASNRLLWRNLRKVESKLLWESHLRLKGQLLQEVYARTGIQLEKDTLTVVWARRFASYKRPDLLFSDLERLKKLLFDTDRPLQIIVSGKSHPADGQGKQIIKHIEDLANFELKHRAVFVDDYSISLAKILVAGADVWLNTPIFGLEASGTSGMKAAANGALQCTVPDGWAYEVDWQGVGFVLAPEKTETEIYPLFEKRILPRFYDRSAQGIPELWVKMMKESMASISPRFSSQRMVEEYIQLMYLPALAQK